MNKKQQTNHKIIHNPKNTATQHFICQACGAEISLAGAGSRHRNHCPHCLCSVHLDNAPGDRAANCGGIMEPIGVWVRDNSEWALLHRCQRCGVIHSNRIAADDNLFKLLSLAVKPLAAPPVPLDLLTQQLQENGRY